MGVTVILVLKTVQQDNAKYSSLSALCSLSTDLAPDLLVLSTNCFSNKLTPQKLLSWIIPRIITDSYIGDWS